MFIVLSSSLNRWDVFVLKEEVGRMPRRCAATLPPFWEKTFPYSVFSFFVEEAAAWMEGLDWDILFGVHLTQKSR